MGVCFQTEQTSASSVEKVCYNSLTSAHNAHLFILTTSGLPQVLLRNRRPDLDERVDDGNSPLIFASRYTLPELVRHLIKIGVKINSEDNQGLLGILYLSTLQSELSQPMRGKILLINMQRYTNAK